MKRPWIEINDQHGAWLSCECTNRPTCPCRACGADAAHRSRRHRDRKMNGRLGNCRADVLRGAWPFLHRPERGGRFLGFYGFFDAGDPSEVGRFQRRVKGRFDGRMAMRLQCGAHALEKLVRIRTAAGVVQKGLRIEIVMKVQEIELLADDPDHPSSAAPTASAFTRPSSGLRVFAKRQPTRWVLLSTCETPWRMVKSRVRLDMSRAEASSDHPQIQYDAAFRQLQGQLRAGQMATGRRRAGFRTVPTGACKRGASAPSASRQFQAAKKTRASPPHASSSSERRAVR